jgi:hypothetical protein
MSKNFLFVFLAATLTACTASRGTGTSSQAVVLDVRCATDDACPSGFQCETEIEHGTDTSYCVSDDSAGTSTGECPAGYELETEHAETFCKPHGDDDGASGGSQPAGGACTSSADCAPGLECETETEHGVTTSVCRAHGGNG